MTVRADPLRTPPVPPLQDEAVRLHLPRADDAPAIAAACADPEIARWVPIPVPYTLADARDFLALVAEGWETGAHSTFVIEDRATATLAGMITLDPGARPGRASVGYWLAARARGRGLVTRAVRLLVAWAFEDPGLERLELMTLVGNEASGRVAVRCGFRREGILRRHLPFRGRSVDAVMYAMVRDDLAGATSAADTAATAAAATAPAPAAGATASAATAGATATPSAAATGAAPGVGTCSADEGELGSLSDALDAWDRTAAAVGALAGLGGRAATPLAAELVDVLREEVARRAADPPSFDPRVAADRRDSMIALLQRIGVPGAPGAAASLVALGWDGNELDDLLAPFGSDEARLVVARWLAASAHVRLLLPGGAGASR